MIHKKFLSFTLFVFLVSLLSLTASLFLPAPQAGALTQQQKALSYCRGQVPTSINDAVKGIVPVDPALVNEHVAVCAAGYAAALKPGAKAPPSNNYSSPQGICHTQIYKNDSDSAYWCEVGYIHAYPNNPTSAPSQPQPSPQAPPISDCNKAKGQDDQQKCKQKYRDCNNGSAVVQCKKDVIDKFTNNPAANPSPSAPSHHPAPATTPCNLDSGCDLVKTYVNPLINLLSVAFGLIAVISIIMGGIQYSASEGDPQKSSQAKKRIYNTLIALFAYLFLYIFLQFLIPGGLFH